MSILSEILNEEYERLNNTISSYEALAAELPKGSIREKLINGRKYLYLQWREGNRVRSRYVKPDEFIALSEQIERRRGYEREIKSLRKSRKEFDKVVEKGI